MSPVSHIGFQNLLYRKFVSPGEHDAKKVASAINLNLSTFYNYIEGVTNCPVDIVANIYNATLDTEFLTFILDNTNQRLCPRSASEGEKTILEEALDVAAAIGALVATTHRGLADDDLDAGDKRDIARAIEKGHKELEDLKRCLR